MKRLPKWIASVVAMMTTIGTSWALSPGWQEIAPYTENFASATASGSKFTKLPDYWAVKGTGSVWYASSGYVGATSDLTSNTTDYLITPQVKGDVTFKAKYAYWSSKNYANVTVYKCALEEGEYVLGDEVLNQSLTETSSWATFTLATEATEYSSYAIHLSGAYFDDFSATSAYVNVPEVRQFVPTAVASEWTDNNPLFADASGNGTWTGKVKVKNTGNVELTPGMENFSLTVASAAAYAVTTTMTTFNISETLAVDEEKEFEIEVPISLAKAEDGRTAMKFTTNMLPAGTTASTSSNYKQSSWFYLKTIAPKLYVRNYNSSDVSNYTTELGLQPAPASTIFSLRNDGGSPVVLKGIESSFVNVTWSHLDSSAVEFPLTIAKGECDTLIMTLNNAGGQASILTFKYGNTYDETEYEVVSKEVSAVVSDPSLYLEQFDSYLTVPADWCQPGWLNQPGSNWTFNSSNSNTYAQNNVQQIPAAYLITPMLSFADGQSLTVAAQPRTNPGSSDCFVKVLYSADRQNWAVAGYIGYVNGSGVATKTSAEGVDAALVHGWSVTSGNGSLNSSYCKAYIIDVPAGDWYIGFQSGYSIIDYVYGGTLKELNHDLYFEALQAPAKATVNYPVAVSFKYTNMNNKKEQNYTVELYNGTNKLASFAKDSLLAYTSDEVAYEFTPHAIDTLNLQFKVVLSDTTISSAVAVIPVAQEVASADALVGERTSATGAYAPFSLNYYNSKSEFIYTAERLGLEAGTQLNSITFPYYNTSKDIQAEVRIYMENTEDATLSAFTGDTAQMVKVYDNAEHQFKMGGADKEHALMKFEFEAPFTYTGQNLRFVLVSENGKSYNNYNFEYVTSTGSVWCKRVDSFSSYQTNAGFATSNLPVCYLGYTVETPTVSGVVTNAETGEAIADTKVRFTSGEVYYEDTTDAEGKYSVTIMQKDLKYVATVDSVAGVYAYASDSILFTADSVLDFALAAVPSVVSGVVTNGKTGEVMADTKVLFTSGEVAYADTTDAEGKYSVAILKTALKYVVTVDSVAGVHPFVSDSTLFAADSVLNITLAEVLPGTAQFAPVFHVTSVAGDSLKGVKVSLKNEAFGLVYPEVAINAEGFAAFTQVLNGENIVSIDASALGLAPYSAAIDIESSDTIEVVLQEATRLPYGLKAEVEHDVVSGNNAVAFTWNKETNYFFDDFESYEPFSIDFSPWTGIDGDKEQTAQISGTYANAQVPQYATIFNPLVIEPSVWDEYPVLRPYSGSQYVGVIRTASGNANNDWIISPRIKVGVGNVVTFMAKAADRTNENFRVLISKTGKEIDDFVSLTEGNYESVEYSAWKTISYDLAAYEGDSVYVAINCISKAAFMLMIDDFYVGPSAADLNTAIGTARPNEKFVVLCDGDSVATVDEPYYYFENLDGGVHTLGVKAVYRTCETDTVTISTTIPGAEAYSSLSLKIATNNGYSAEDAEVELSDLISGKSFEPVFVDGVATYASMPKGTYAVTASLEGYQSVSDTVVFESDTLVEIVLKEEILKPFGLYVAELTEVTPSNFTAQLEWNADFGIVESFEEYAAFTSTIGDYITYDGDQTPCYKISFSGTDVTMGDFGQYGNIAAMVFNPNATTPAVAQDAYFCALTGNQFLAFMSPQGKTADDWFIIPSTKIGADYVVRFYGRAYSAAYKENVEVCVSTTYSGEGKPTGFQSIGTMTLVNESGAWVLYEVSLDQFVGQDVYVALHYVSADKWIAEIDDLYVGPKQATSQISVDNVKNYELYLDGTKVGDSFETSYTFADLSAGVHTLGVVAVYTSGNSEMATIQIECVPATGIRSIETEASAPEFYDLLGRRVQNRKAGQFYLQRK